MNDGRVLTVNQVAERLQVTPRTVKAWLTDGRLQGIKMGRLWRIRPEAVEELLRSYEHSRAAR
jgi:excisionase family DNA binding protein